MWAGSFGVFTSTEAAAAEIRAKHLHAVVRLVPFTLGANLLNGTIVWLTLRPTAPGPLLVGWMIVLGVVASMGIAAWWRSSRGRHDRASPRAIRRAVLHAAVLAAVWAALPVIWYPGATMPQRLMLAMLTTGTLGAGAMALAPVPAASVAFVVITAWGACLALLQTRDPLMLPEVALVLIYAATMIASALSTARMSVARFLSEQEASQQGHVIGLLLRDFEENTADILWETDHDGRLVHISPRLGALLDGDDDLLMTISFLDVLAQRRPLSVSERAHDPLHAAFASGIAFRDIVIPVSAEGTMQYWSFTAKPLSPVNGSHAGWRGVIGDVSERQQALKRLEYLAGYDALTGLANRRLLRDRIQHVLDGTLDIVHRDGTTGKSALLYIDVDHFKNVNDSMGHATGDAVLQLVARRLMATSRLDDFIVRLGGDEFAMVATSPGGAADVIAMAERLLRALREPTEIGDNVVSIGASIGIAMIPDHGRSVDEILGNADLALYAAKHAGRGQHSVYAPELGEKNRRRRLIERELATAVANHEFSLQWQLQATADPSGYRGAEVLLRWAHPELGAVTPAEFIPIAEESRLIEPIGDWVLREACRVAHAELDGMLVSVNVSPQQLRRADFVASVRAALADSGLAATRLELEITESLLIREASSSLEKLHQLRAMGVRIALDDFGTGYSSLAYLRRFPFDTLKIDRAFIKELTHAGDARAIVRMIIELATTLGMETVAESVEDDAQLALLRDAGCMGFQGSAVARPMSIDGVQSLLRQAKAARSALPTTLGRA